MSSTNDLKEGRDYYIDDRGFFVFTEEYHKNEAFAANLAANTVLMGLRKSNVQGI